MKKNLSQLRANIFKLIDRILETGEPLEIERKGRQLRIVPVVGEGKLDRLIERPDYIRGEPDDLIHLDWSEEWKP